MNINSAIDKVTGRIGKMLPAGYPMIDGGKMARANLLLAFASNENAETIEIAAAIELLHAATLIHDDILDNSAFRRGRPPIFREIGVSSGILYGDYLFTKAFSAISGLMDPVLNKEITLALSEVLEGEMIEKRGAGDITAGPAGYFSVIQKKTGTLFAISSKLGALQGAKGDLFAEKAYDFGLKTGTAYQIVDDLLDYFGTSTGKDRFNDIKGGLVTLPLIYLIERCSPEETSYIRSLFGKENPDPKDLIKVTELMDSYNVPVDVVRMSDRLLEEAESAIGKNIYSEVSSVFDVLSWVKRQVRYG